MKKQKKMKIIERYRNFLINFYPKAKHYTMFQLHFGEKGRGLIALIILFFIILCFIFSCI